MGYRLLYYVMCLLSMCFLFSNDEVSNKHIQPLAKKFIRTSIRLTIGHLKKYLRLKLNLPNKKEVSLKTLFFTCDG